MSARLSVTCAMVAKVHPQLIATTVPITRPGAYRESVFVTRTTQVPIARCLWKAALINAPTVRQGSALSALKMQ